MCLNVDVAVVQQESNFRIFQRIRLSKNVHIAYCEDFEGMFVPGNDIFRKVASRKRKAFSEPTKRDIPIFVSGHLYCAYLFWV